MIETLKWVALYSVVALIAAIAVGKWLKHNRLKSGEHFDDEWTK